MERYRPELELSEGVYFNHAVRGPLPIAAVRALAAAAAATHTPTKERRWLTDRTRAQLAALIGAEPHEVAFVSNTAEAMGITLDGVRFNEGDNVVGIEGDFPSVSYPLINLKRRGVSYRGVAVVDGEVDAESVISRIDGRTRVVAISWVLHASGCRLDLRAIGAVCRKHCALFVVDVAQGLAGC